MGLGLSNCCEICDAPDPHWCLMRRGDAVITWACDSDLAQVADRLQRDHEVTELLLGDFRKAREWVGISHALDEIAEGK